MRIEESTYPKESGQKPTKKRIRLVVHANRKINEDTRAIEAKLQRIANKLKEAGENAWLYVEQIYETRIDCPTGRGEPALC
jgi:hypothetical protein